MSSAVAGTPSNPFAEPAERSRASEAPPQVPDHEVHPRPIGSGSYGRVFLARNVMGRWRAVKVVYRSRFESDRTYERDFEGVRRFEPVSHLHPSQLHVLHVGRNDAAGYFYYVMELADDAAAAFPDLAEAPVPGRNRTSDPGGSVTAPPPIPDLDPNTYVPLTLRQRLDRQGRLPSRDCLETSLALALALAGLHKHGLVHRDIKPSNIVFVNGIPKLADIGLVAVAGARTFVGTDGYLPPEGPGTVAADVFGLGRVMYEMMTGLDRSEFPKLPTGFDGFEDHDGLVELNKVILRAAAEDLGSRYQTAEELHEDLVLVQARKRVLDLRAIARRTKALKVAAWSLGAATVALGVLALLLQTRVARTERRASLILEAERLRLREHRDDWRKKPLDLLGQAGTIRLDSEIRGQAVAVLAGAEVRAKAECRYTAARYLALDPAGRQLLLDGGGEYVPPGRPLTASDFADLPAFAERMKRPSDPVSAHLAGRLSPATRHELASHSGSNPLVPELTATLLEDLKRIVAGDSIFNALRFAGVKLREETREILDRPRGEGSWTELNRMLLEDAYPAELARKRRTCLWDLPTQQCREFVSTHVGPVWFGPNGRPLQFTQVDSGDLVVIDLGSNRTLQTFSVPGMGTSPAPRAAALAVSADGSLCAASMSTDSGGRLALWEVGSGRLLACSDRSCSALAFSPNSDSLAAGGIDGEIGVWSVPEMTLVRALRQDGRAIHCLAFQEELGQATEPAHLRRWLLAAGDAGGVINLYEVSTGRTRRSFSGSHFAVYSLAFSPDGMTLASGGHSAIRFWEIATGRAKAVLGLDRAMTLAFAPDGQALAVGVTSTDGGHATSRVVEVAEGPGVRSLTGLSAPCAKIAFSSDGSRLAVLAHNWELAVWSTATQRLERLLVATPGRYADNAALAFSPDGREIAFATFGIACVWDCGSGRLTLSRSHLPGGWAQQLAYDTAGRLLLLQWDRPASETSGICCVRDLRAQDPLACIAQFRPCRRILCSALSRDGRWAVVCTAGERPEATAHMLEVFDALSGRLMWKLPTKKAASSDSFALDPVGKFLAYEDSETSRMRFYTIPDGKDAGEYPTFVKALSKERQWLATATARETGFELRQLRLPQWSLVLGLDVERTAEVFSADDRYLAWGTTGGTVYLCDLEQTIRDLEAQGLGWR
jgi:WD40 repeat protein